MTKHRSSTTNADEQVLAERIEPYARENFIRVYGSLSEKGRADLRIVLAYLVDDEVSAHALRDLARKLDDDYRKAEAH